MPHWYYWYFLSALLFLLEALAFPGIGFFFAGFGALSTAFIVQHALIGDSWLTQATAFFFLTVVWTAILWIPLKKLKLRRKHKAADRHHDIIGRLATVADGGLKKGQGGGQAKWSGTLFNARLADDAALQAAESGRELKVVDIDGSTLILAEAEYNTTTEPS